MMVRIATKVDGSMNKPVKTWTKVDNRVLPVLAKIHPAAVSIYVAIKSFADKDGICYPSLDAVAARSGVSCRQIVRILPAIIQTGLIEKTRRNTGAGRTSNLYEFTDSPKDNVTLGVGVAQTPNSPSPNAKWSPPKGQCGVGSRSTEVDPLKKIQEEPPKSPKGESGRGTSSNGSTKKKPTKKRAAKKTPRWRAEDVELPAGLGEAFRPTWLEWCQHRREKRSTLTELATHKQLKTLASMGPTRAAIAIEHSITKGYIGLFEPNSNGGNNGRSHRGGNIGSGQKYGAASIYKPGM